MRLIAICTIHGSKRRQDEHEQRTDDAKAAIVVPPPAEKHAELRKHGNSAGNRSGNGHRQRVVVADVAEFVTDNAGDFVTVERVKEPSRRANDGVLRIPPCGKSIFGPWHVLTASMPKSYSDAHCARSRAATNGAIDRLGVGCEKIV